MNVSSKCFSFNPMYLSLPSFENLGPVSRDRALNFTVNTFQEESLTHSISAMKLFVKMMCLHFLFST